VIGQSAVAESQPPEARNRAYPENAVDLSLEKFFANFHVLGEAARAVSRLRDLVLELAIRGRLVRTTEVAVASRAGSALSLAEVPSSWTVLPLGEVAEIVRGITFPASAKMKTPSIGHVVCLRTSNVQRTIEWEDLLYVPEAFVGRTEQWVREGDLCISMANSYELVGKVAQVIGMSRKATFGGFLAIIRPDERVLPAFLTTFMRSPTVQAELRKGATQTTNIANISLGRLRPLPVSVPPLAEQQAIVARVDELMALIDDLEAKQTKKRELSARFTKASLEALTTAELPEEFDAVLKRVVESWDDLLGSSDAVSAIRKSIVGLAIRGRLVVERAAQVSDTAATSGRAITTSEVPFQAPPSWKWARLGSVSTLINGDRGKNYPNKNEYVERGIPFINTGHIRPNAALCSESMHYLTREKFDSLRSGKIQKGDLVYCLRGATLGKTAIVQDFEEGAIASSLVIIRLQRILIPKFAYYFLVSDVGRRLIRQFDNGSAQPNLSANSVKSYVIPVPPLEEQKRIVAKVEHLMKLCDALEAKLRLAEDRASKLVDAVVQEMVA
jgi:type I restriction enzyme S subunit